MPTSSLAYWCFPGESRVSDSDLLAAAPRARGTHSAERDPSLDPSLGRDAEWVQRICAGDRDAFASLYREYLSAMIGFAYRLVESEAIAEDLVADVFTALWDRRATWRPAHGARAYLFRAVRTRALDVLRHARTVTRAHDAVAHSDELPGMGAFAPTIADQLDAEETLRAVDAAIAAMPELRRRVMELRWRDALSIDEVAVVLSISRAAVDQHLSRGLQTLRRLLPEVLGEG